jgi:hypothetical protein
MNYIKNTACATPALQPLSGESFWSGISNFVERRTALLSRPIAAARQFSADLRENDPLLFHLGWIMQALIPLYAVMAFACSGSGIHAGIQAGINPWIKPIKFATSFSTFLWTISPMLLALRIPAWQSKLARQAIAFGAIMEMVFLSAQAGRSTYFSGPATSTDTIIFHGTSAMISVITTVCLGMTVLYFFNSRVAIEDKTMLAAVRCSLVIFMIGNAVGGYMLARGSHTVGAPDGGPGMPFTNWSTIGGDLRIAHFIAIHAIQILPLLAWAVLEFMPAMPAAKRKITLYAATAVLALAVGGTFIQAAMARPLVAIGQTQQVARK